MSGHAFAADVQLVLQMEMDSGLSTDEHFHINQASLDLLVEKFMQLFDACVSKNPEMLELLCARTSFERHNELMRAHLDKVFGDISSSEAHNISNAVGKSHINNGVRLSWYLTSYNNVFEAFHWAQQNSQLEFPDIDQFRNLWLRDAGNTLDAYYELLTQQHDEESSLMQQSIAKLDLQARTDPLTQILNRRGLQEAVDSSVFTGAFILFDLDDFKSVNDLRGHIVGDSILQKIASGLKAHLRSNDLVGRIGGDEFALWLPGLDVGNSLEIQSVVRRIIEGISFQAWGIGISGGMTQKNGPSTKFDNLYARADAALYNAKSRQNFTICSWEGDIVLDITPV